MRNFAIAVAALAATATVLFAPAASAAEHQAAAPTCLINMGGHFDHSSTCADLRSAGPRHLATGRYAPSDRGLHVLTVTLQTARPGHGPVRWQTIDTATARGFGQLVAGTRPMMAPWGGRLRACAQASDFIGRGHGQQVCTG